MFWLALAAAAQMSAPIPTNQKNWFSPNDIPRDLIIKGNGLWQVGVELTVGPDGILRGCNISSTAGLAELDALTCELLRRRAKFLPAHSSDGTPAYGVYRTSIRWVLADQPWDTSKVSNPDMDLSVQKLPAGLSSPVLVRVMFGVDAQGHLSSCMAEPGPTLEHVNNDATLVSVACEQLMQAFNPAPAKDLTGAPLASIQDAEVRFSAQ
jgi:hypothetical protein